MLPVRSALKSSRAWLDKGILRREAESRVLYIAPEGEFELLRLGIDPHSTASSKSARRPAATFRYI